MRGLVSRLLARAGSAVWLWLRPALALLLAAAGLALRAASALAGGDTGGDGTTVP